MPSGTTAAPRLHSRYTDLTELARGVLDRHFGVPFLFVTPGETSELPQEWPIVNRETIQALATKCVHETRVLVQQVTDQLQALAIPLKGATRHDGAAVGLFSLMVSDTPGPRGVDSADRTAQTPYCQPELLDRLGNAAMAAMLDRRQLCARELELKQMAAQLARNYEEITLLHQLTREAQISLGVESLQHMTLVMLGDILPARQIVYVPFEATSATLLQGDTILEPHQCRKLVERLGTHANRSVVVDNRLSERDLGPEYRALVHLICVPVVEGKEQFGWLVALGRSEDSELGSVEASLMTAVAAILATHQTNVKLYGDIKDLFLGIVRALTSAIDAKDPYTCGHSERVAQLAYQIARKMGLTEDQQNRVYLSGLLHDVGKIGIRDSVLLKTGRLTDEELAHMKQHTTIGFDILCSVRQLQPLMSGVRSHHENFDGTGYPDGLKGADIPLMARIVAAADSFDAMSSNRPYRNALNPDQVVQTFRNGAGRQWDASVIAVLLQMLSEPESEQAISRATPPAEVTAESILNGPKWSAGSDTIAPSCV